MEDVRPPKVATGAVIFSPNNKILLLKSHKWNGKLVVPGGKIHFGETALACIQREVLEETGLEIFNIEFLGMCELIQDASFHKPEHFIFLDYVCKAKTEKVILDSESQDFVWAKMDEIKNYAITDSSLNLIEKALKEYLKN